MKLFLSLILLFFSFNAFSKEIVNVYVWGGEIPDSVIQSFEKETGIKVNFSNYDNNETMFAKLKLSRNIDYDVILPSSYYVSRMSKLGMLQKLNLKNLPNMAHVAPFFLNRPFDPKNQYSVPFTWGITGILLNEKFTLTKNVVSWNDFWRPKFFHQLLLLDDTREVFSMALLSLGYPANDENPQHIKQAYEKLLRLLPNVKLFAPEAVVTIYADEDAYLGMSWNGDAVSAQKDNSALKFIFPKEGFVIWVDSFAIVKNAPHLENAYRFINYLLKPESAKAAAINYGFATTNRTARQGLPNNIQRNQTLYPSPDILARGQFQTDVSNASLNLYEKYWELLKLNS